jgi:pyrroline-5-carboxylate reductase
MNDIGIIGLGTLGSAIARGLHRVLPRLRIFATTRTSAVPHDVTRCASNADLAARTRTIVVCVKPHDALSVLRELAPVLTRGHRVISTCAAVPLEVLAQVLPGHARVARAMPNIACEFNEGVTALAFASGWTACERGGVLELFGALGDAVPLEQMHFDAVTALSGCGPAYVCTIAEALGDAGIKAGLPRDVARRMAVQTLLGSSVLLRSAQEHPAVIRDRVTTPGGCTTEALAQLEERALRATLIAAVSAASEKSARLSSTREMPRADVPPCAV